MNVHILWISYLHLEKNRIFEMWPELRIFMIFVRIEGLIKSQDVCYAVLFTGLCSSCAKTWLIIYFAISKKKKKILTRIKKY
jgi:hypothetical protein